MENQIDKYDRQYGSLIDVSLHTKPTTVKVVQPLTGRTETFIVQTLRHENGDYVFLEHADEAGLDRLVLPPKVVNAIVAHRDSLTKRSRSRTARRVMAERMARGDVISFKKKKAQ